LAGIAGVEFLAPLIEKGQRCGGGADFVAKIVRNAAVGVDGVEVRAQGLGEKPGGDVEVFVVGFGEVPTPGLGFFERRWGGRDAIGFGERSPALGEEFVVGQKGGRSGVQRLSSLARLFECHIHGLEPMQCSRDMQQSDSEIRILESRSFDFLRYSSVARDGQNPKSNRRSFDSPPPN